MFEKFLPFLYIVCWNYPLVSLKSQENELLFRNITILLDKLLEDYDSSQHPNLRQGTPTTIRTNILIRSMGPISELEMDYSLDWYLQLFHNPLKNPFLIYIFQKVILDSIGETLGPVDSLSLNIKMLEKLWRPDTYFHNGKKSYIHTITLPNKLLRINQMGDITYSMRLTIKAKCPMCLKSFPFDKQSCPLIIGSYAYDSRHIVYIWDKLGSGESVSFVPGLTLSQFDLISSPYKNYSLKRKDGNHIGEFSALQVNFSFVRHKGYFLIQVYVPCVLIVVLSWVSFWLNREATSDRVALGITAFLTLSTLSLDSRVDLPKVHYATALDSFLLMCFAYCMATLLEFAGVHYFTKIGSGEVYPDAEDDDPVEEWVGGKNDEEVNFPIVFNDGGYGWSNTNTVTTTTANRIRCGLSPITPPGFLIETPSKSVESKETQTERKLSCLRQFSYCIAANERYRRERNQAAILEGSSNSVSRIDRISRIFFPLSFLILNIFYWLMYSQQETCEH